MTWRAWAGMAAWVGLLGCAGATAQEVPLPVPETIRAEGVPAVPAAIPAMLGRFQEIRSASFADWVKADRPTMLVTTRFAATTQVHRVSMPGGARYQLTFERERVMGAAARPGHAAFAFLMDEGGAENAQVYLQEMAGGSPVRLSDGKSRHTEGSWSASGRKLAWSSNARNGRDMDLYVVDLGEAVPAPRLFKEVAGSWAVADWSPDEARVVAIEYISINETYVHVVDLATGKTQTLTPRVEAGAETVAYGEAEWAPDGKSIYWTSDAGSEFQQLSRYDLATRAVEVLTPGIPWDIESFDISDDGALVALFANEGGLSRLRVIEVASGAERAAPAIPAGVAGGLSFRPGSHEIGFTLSSARSASDAYAADLDRGTVVRWTESELAGLDAARFPEPELIAFASFDGRKIPAFVYRPDPARFPGPRPVLMVIHGGPEGQYRPAFLGRNNALVEQLGLALVYPNVRGSSGYGKTYLKLDNGMKREDSVKDIGALLDWIGQDPGLDATRVGVTGGSYGGYMSLAVQTTYPDRIRAGIDIVGISNFVTFLENTQDYRRDLRRVEYGDERDPAMRAFLQEISPLARVERIANPLLVIQGQNDPRVPLSESDQVVAAVRSRGKPVWYVVGTNEGHGFAKRPNQDYAQAVEVLFLKQFLLGEGQAP